MEERELLTSTLKKEKKVRQEIKKNPSRSVIFQPLLFVGEKYNQKLLKLPQENRVKNINFIDFSKIGAAEKNDGHWIEKEIKRVCGKYSKNEEFPLLCLLNLNEISGTVLEKALLPFFDYYQNTQHQDLDLSSFILITTSSTPQLEKISPPLLSRLKCVNQNQAELSKTFLDRHFNLVLIGSILLLLILLLLIFLPKKITS
ncbi:MAG: hypothetical protein MRERC_2c013 [Mycoplasmataceae bacterium RC_NB112A]|nr:MAG: hypothetical protein MRERC_6c088 [Mycoplasmataceae bacterium RC_NB112A]KLL02141.1 MAG: hypothetical protein MRERC_4c101 [Mycoplasmataceae bacterium RC_NB112A]KLL02168.1 MAG: hypothetical protein MRERC_4c142 [Mycoplasmataceae bacterium RC_NB112A]KLL02302.1 MAG: hypothetical protein MRERC_2c013 [Mycoplasmataceae bacterium RC_NB112A]